MTNRPLSLIIQDLENDEIPTDIPRDYTYNTVDSYVSDILGFHDSRFRNQLNAVNDDADAFFQLGALAAMRTILPTFTRRELRRGPFVMSLTDLHQSNIFVDKDWHITCLVDLEWACSEPIEMIQPPYWLTNKTVDCIIPEVYDEPRKEFMGALEKEEAQLAGIIPLKSAIPRLSTVMEEGWRIGTFWYTLALTSRTGIFLLFYRQIQRRIYGDQSSGPPFITTMPWYWAQDMPFIVMEKVEDKRLYDNRLRQAFEDDT